MFNPYNWYWLADDGRLFSSAEQSLIAHDTPSYLEWLGGTHQPTRWPCDDVGVQTEAALEEVLTVYGLALTPATLVETKSSLKLQIDAAAETERLKYITPGNGQAMTYQQKVAEAQAFKAATSSQASDYPMLSSEVGITGETIEDVADIVLAAFAQWQQIGAMIEAIRLGAKRDIEAAEDETTARSIVDAIVWPSAHVQP